MQKDPKTSQISSGYQKEEPTLIIETEKTLYKTDDTIKGMLTLKTFSPMYVYKIELRVYKEFTCRINSETEKKKQSSPTTFDLYQNNLEFTELSTGNHTFPFDLKIKKEMKGTTNTSLYFSGKTFNLRNQIILEAILYGDNKKQKIYKKSIDLNFYNIAKKNKPTIFDMEFTYCFCLFYSECKLRINSDKDFYYSGETAKITVEVLKSYSPIKIKSVTLELFQNMLLDSGSKFYKEKKLLFKTKGYFCNLENLFCADMRIPFSVPNNIHESHLSLTNFVQITITFDRSLPVLITRDVCIVKDIFKPPMLQDESLIQGITLAKRVFKY